MKRLIQIGLIVITLIFLLAGTVALQQVDPKQKEPTGEPYAFDDTLAGRRYNLDSLKKIIGENKGLPPGFEVQAAIAYSAFPQLKAAHIDMILTEGGAPMESTVEIGSLFEGRRNRRYHVLLNDAHNSFFDPILLRSLPFDAQVGILAHELGHIVYYENLNIFGFGNWGLRYIMEEDFRAAHERTTDLMPVYYGLGSQIYQYAYFVRNDPTCKSLYAEDKGFIDKYYLTDKELSAAIAAQKSH
ncbi:MAG TPA: hypothetical protein VFG46_28775 [Chryseolinea sp.]|nr:hypothetical protein [Chryseolinea sp.]